MDEPPAAATAAPGAPEEHGTRLRNNAFTGITMVVYFRHMAAAGPRNAVTMLAIPLISAAFLLYVVWKSVPGLGGWTSGSLISLYVLLGIGAVIMIYGRATNTSAYFATAREVFQPGPGPVTGPPPQA